MNGHWLFPWFNETCMCAFLRYQFSSNVYAPLNELTILLEKNWTLYWMGFWVLSQWIMTGTWIWRPPHLECEGFKLMKAHWFSNECSLFKGSMKHVERPFETSCFFLCVCCNKRSYNMASSWWMCKSYLLVVSCYYFLLGTGLWGAYLYIRSLQWASESCSSLHTRTDGRCGSCKGLRLCPGSSLRVFVQLLPSLGHNFHRRHPPLIWI